VRDLSSGKLRVISELAGATAVLLGLIFVGLELRQNTAALSAQAIFELNNSGNNNHGLAVQDESLEELIHNGHKDPDSLSESDRRRYVRWMRMRFNAAEAAWIYQNKGLLNESEYAGYRSGLCGDLSRKGARWFWDNKFGNYAEGFVEDVESWCFD